MSRVAIKSDGTSDGTTILVDGVDVGDVCMSATVVITPAGYPQATLELLELETDLCTDDVYIYKACANCRGTLDAPPRRFEPSSAEALLRRVLDAHADRRIVAMPTDLFEAIREHLR